MQFSSVAQSCPTLCNPIDCSMPGLPVHHQLPEFTQTHVHWVSDATENIEYQDSGPTSSCWLTTLFSFRREALGHQTQQIAWLRHQSDKSVIKHTFQVLRCSNLLSPNVMARFIFPGAISVITQVALVVKELTCQCRRFKRHGFNPWVGKIPWKREWQPTSAFLTGKSNGQRSLVGYSPWGCNRIRYDLVIKQLQNRIIVKQW